MVDVETRGSGLDCVDVLNRYKSSGCCADISNDMKVASVVIDSHDDNEAKLRCLFDQALSIFLNEATGRGCIRPLPALLADGQTLDLFKLFRVVRRRGGLDLVSGFWTFVAKELGLERSACASIKLIYFKYLYELERWLSGCCVGRRLGNGELELEARFRILLSDGGYRRVNCNKHSLSDSNNSGKCVDLDAGKGEIGLLGTKFLDINRHIVDDEKFCSENRKYHNDEDSDILILDPSTYKKDIISRKRKRKSLSEVLDWVVQIAKCPYGSSVGQIPQFSKWKDHGGNDLWLQAVRARDSLLQCRWVDSNLKENSFQSNQKIHPSMFDDINPPNEQCSERLRCSERIIASAKTPPCACCNSSSSHQGKHLISPKTDFDNGHKEQEPVSEILPSSATPSVSEDESLRIHPFVGPRFQAKVPEWSGMASESDSKWLGTRVWPMENGYDNASVELDIIGKGRPSSCNCRLLGSVECVRFHIAEKRMKLKREIGKVFYHWRFDRMGEEVSLRWTAVEEARFKDMVQFNPPSLGKCFWDEASDNFPTKKREELVSYYFDVFLVRRRCYQNRVTPKNIDSDDDESEFGCLGNLYGTEAVKVSGTNIMQCLENKECTDFK